MSVDPITMFDSIDSFIKSISLTRTKKLGCGGFGCAWLVRPSKKSVYPFRQAVLKITADASEYLGAKSISKLHGWEVTDLVPVIYGYGRFDAKDWLEFTLTNNLSLGYELYTPAHGLFYYIREELDDVPPTLMSRKITIDSVKKIRKDLHLLVVDNSLENWGMRPEDVTKYLENKKYKPKIVLRDLSMLFDKGKK